MMDRDKFWHDFFQLYKDLPALWRVKSTEYTDRVLKTNCYLKLIRKLKEIYPDADREMVVKKINNFRTSYRKELKRLKENKQRGKTYTPTLWYFDSLSFLNGQDEDGGDKSINGDENMDEKKPSQSVNTNRLAYKKLPTKRYGDFKDNEEEEILPSTSKRKKLNTRYSKKQSRKLSYEDKQQAKIDDEILAKSWAVQYKEMQGDQKLIARKLISDILFYGCLGTLNMSHPIDLQEILLKETNVAQPQSPMESNSSIRFAEHEYVNYQSLRESPIDFNSCSSPLSPIVNSVPELQVNEIKFEMP